MSARLVLLGSVLVMILLAPWSVVRAEEGPADVRERLEEALSVYADALQEPDRDARIAQFARAERGFASVVERGIDNAALQTNLGNAALQAEHVGGAVLAYRRALRLDPDAETARQNLAHVRSLLPAWVPRPAAPGDAQPLRFDRRIPLSTRSMAAAVCFALAAASLAFSIRRREGAWRGLAWTGFALWGLLMASIAFDSRLDDSRGAVVTSAEALARSADSRLASLAYPQPLPQGVEVEILEERPDWVRVRLYNGRDVWLRETSITRVEG